MLWHEKVIRVGIIFYAPYKNFNNRVQKILLKKYDDVETMALTIPSYIKYCYTYSIDMLEFDVDYNFISEKKNMKVLRILISDMNRIFRQSK